MNRTSIISIAALLALALGCASAPETRPQERSIQAAADATISDMTREDPSLGAMLQAAPGYVVFPTVGEGGFIGGVAAGVGVVYEDGLPIGYAELREGSVGAQLGGHSYSQLIVFDTQAALERLKSNNFDLTADASATLIRSGAAASVTFEDGTAVFVDDESGLMAEASIAGQSITFEPS